MTKSQRNAVAKIRANGGWVRATSSYQFCNEHADAIHFSVANRLESAGLIRRDENYFTHGHEGSGRIWIVG